MAEEIPHYQDNTINWQILMALSYSIVVLQLGYHPPINCLSCVDYVDNYVKDYVDWALSLLSVTCKKLVNSSSLEVNSTLSQSRVLTVLKFLWGVFRLPKTTALNNLYSESDGILEFIIRLIKHSCLIK